MPRSRVTNKTGAPVAGTLSCRTCGGTGFVIGEDGTVASCDCGAAAERESGRRLSAAGIPPRFAGKTLAAFKAVTPAHAAVRDAAASWAESFSLDPEHGGLLLRGTTGSGKTHIAAAILRDVVLRGHSGRFCGFPDLLARIRDSYNDQTGDTEAEILDELGGADLVVLDDVGAEVTSDWVRERLYIIVNRRYESTRPMIITTNCPEEELDKRIGRRTASRLYEICRDPFPRFPEVDWRRTNMK